MPTLTQWLCIVGALIVLLVIERNGGGWGSHCPPSTVALPCKEASK